jgi:hypothetical protein
MYITPTHILLSGAVWYFDRRLALYKEKPKCDLIKDYVPPIKFASCWYTSIVPLYLLFANETTSPNANRIIEHCAAIYILVLVLNTLKRSINPCSDLNSIDYIVPAIVLLNLAVCFYSLVPPQYIAGYMGSILCLTIFLRLCDPNSEITTSAMFNDIVLSTLMFVIYKKDLKLVFA